ncbi:TonB-dependent receptor [Hyphomonas sp. WL0036]|uniref:TonB-dependent receptor n=1 Tax=Hyphomonas sediminis TaxID=2866160 RepID=UPI001C7E4526|nr:TonB-dependent receptor [Hyphomonas sediminis]MBY9068495.1 TonB-dependent receptor [Hyphomonas sediminis]
MRSLVLICLSCLLAPGFAEAQSVPLSVPALPLPDALNRLSEQTGHVIIASSSDLPDIQTRPLKARMTPEAALAYLLEGTGLKAQQQSGGAWVVRALPRPRTLPPTGSRPPLFPAPADKVRVYETVIVTGSRTGLPAIESMSPIQVLGPSDIAAPVSDDLTDVMATLVPGFYVQRRPLSDGAVFVRPYSLRNLSADHTLVLIDGKRRHRSAMLNTGGAQSSDLSKLPTNAIGRIEVLRDGASAQYGSDAIAGVINVITRQDAAPDAYGQYSQYYAGDGIQKRFGAGGGMDTGDGSFRLAFDYSDAAPTSRARQRQDALDYLEAHPDVALPDPVQKWGQPEREDFRTLATASHETPLGRVYALASYSWGQGVSDFNWRSPNASSAYAISPAFDGWSLRDLYPHGFKPQFGQDEQDGSVMLGLKHTTAKGLSYDLSFGAGENSIGYFLYDTINASMGPESPLSFNAGGLRQREYTLNADFQKTLSPGMLTSRPIEFAFGFEHRLERYSIRAGDSASYQIGPGAADGLTSGSNGFPGYTALQARTYGHASSAAYIDTVIQPSETTRLGLAARFEEFDSYGDRLNGKLSVRQDIGGGLIARATVSTAFKAPTPAQSYSERTSQGVDPETLDIFTNGRFAPVGPVANILSQRSGTRIDSLRPETSTNLSAGLVWRPQGAFTASLDVYSIDVRDRIFNSETYTLTDAERSSLAALNIPGGESITRVQFYQNDFDTRTSGFDLSLDHDRPFAGGELSLRILGNYNETEVVNVAASASSLRIEQFERIFPKYAGIFSAEYARGPVRLDSRVRVIGPWADYSDQTGTVVQTFGTELFVDVGATLDIGAQTTLRIGAENLFNEYPEEARLEASKGLIYSRNAPYDTDGGQYYVRLNVRL